MAGGVGGYQAVAASSRVNLSQLPHPSPTSSGSNTNGGGFPNSPQYTHPNSISTKFSLTPDPKRWDLVVSPGVAEPDDYLHNPDPRRDRLNDNHFVISGRGIANVGCLFILMAALLGLFVGFPVVKYFTTSTLSTQGGFNLGGTNGSGQVPDIGNFGLIDRETPQDAYTLTSYTDGTTEYDLVFSDEFNTDGRTFWPGDDPYCALLNNSQTGDLEWYSPAAITTANGSLQITLSKQNPATNHNLSYQGGMLTSWNKFCFTGGIFVASVRIPGSNNVVGLWPAVWTMGNLGRAGYGASLDGLVYVGTVANQSVNGIPAAAVDGTGDKGNGGSLSYLEGQRLSRCTCPGESHPGPIHSDGHMSDPFDYQYKWQNTSENYIIYNKSDTTYNEYMGVPISSLLLRYQPQVSHKWIDRFVLLPNFTSATRPTLLPIEWNMLFNYGIEYLPGYASDNGFITWIQNNTAAWSMNAAGMGADTKVNISARPVSQEPMKTSGGIDLANLVFPAVMSIDWVRVYQKKGETNIGCDPVDFPTAAYIQEYSEAYTNENLTTWEQYGQPMPKNSFLKSMLDTLPL
ncbi:beta-glucan synthesis-associated [Rhodocollybia butyracea]|uniref:Beta-glucan synthesis-associated n=1 Tax=Rhodocollybia butyracea TaxID=206335 RepID=A0A9P5PT40_9AGAR|nr:beta-glucan synthesis-associated [Rhodocollybia butyracea]